MGDPTRHIAHVYVVCPLARDMGDPARHIAHVHVFFPLARDMGDPARHIAHAQSVCSLVKHVHKVPFKLITFVHQILGVLAVSSMAIFACCTALQFVFATCAQQICTTHVVGTTALASDEFRYIFRSRLKVRLDWV